VSNRAGTWKGVSLCDPSFGEVLGHLQEGLSDLRVNVFGQLKVFEQLKAFEQLKVNTTRNVLRQRDKTKKFTH
jgi:hypothetical protein